ncbi:hypothetical protein EMIHUDRAFT_242747 [Emiliania huxleyi CCMP1516]|uniref:Protein YIPF n=2 Tax=Emiliania huxleyi TaxID=2903 RepID=A0A0D3J861_EMIH1|nr:hypothetical protein EMIHUDRAFT_242747 [Emiliania huxleyi CCMP1516]EOD19696.1 hypothetical protein EMIHUDRAFT_242747 [Emiliania huxleyi CCMP1516]|eukprot:XP_005772125.1 hypothetical protein EMIHUDRAFT_242747 [Emiliania huxleyi CCMP1516]
MAAHLLEIDASEACRSGPRLCCRSRAPHTRLAQLNPQTLSFQDFGSSGGAGASSASPSATAGGMGGAIGSGMLKPQSLEQMQDVEGQPGSSGFWTLRYYQPLFDIDTIQGSNFFRGLVLNRIKGSLLPRPRGVFFDLISANPDLWGPFWIATTLIFAMAHLSDCFPYGEGAPEPRCTCDAKRKMATLLGGMAACHFVLLLLFKLYFFHYA